MSHDTAALDEEVRVQIHGHCGREQAQREDRRKGHEGHGHKGEERLGAEGAQHPGLLRRQLLGRRGRLDHQSGHRGEDAEDGEAGEADAQLRGGRDDATGTVQVPEEVPGKKRVALKPDEEQEQDVGEHVGASPFADDLHHLGRARCWTRSLYPILYLTYIS